MVVMIGEVMVLEREGQRPRLTWWDCGGVVTRVRSVC